MASLVLGWAGLTAGAVYAAPAPSSGPSTQGLDINDGSAVVAGIPATVSGSGFHVKADSPCFLYFDEGNATSCEVTAAGSFEGTIDIPATASGGHRIEVCMRVCDGTQYPGDQAGTSETANIVVVAQSPTPTQRPSLSVSPYDAKANRPGPGTMLALAGTHFPADRQGQPCVLYWNRAFLTTCDLTPRGTIHQEFTIPAVETRVTNRVEVCTVDCSNLSFSPDADPRLNASTVVLVLQPVQTSSPPVSSAPPTSSSTSGSVTPSISSSHSKLPPPPDHGIGLSGGGALTVGGAAILGLSGVGLQTSRRRVRRDRARRWVQQHVQTKVGLDGRDDVRLDQLDRTPTLRVGLRAIPDPSDLE